MNSTTTPTGNPERLAENAENIFENLSENEKKFIKDNIPSFENFFATNPLAALESFRIPYFENNSQSVLFWNAFLDRKKTEFVLTMPEKQEEILENFYEKMLDLTNSEPTPSMRTRSKMRRVMEKFFENSESLF